MPVPERTSGEIARRRPSLSHVLFVEAGGTQALPCSLLATVVMVIWWVVVVVVGFTDFLICSRN
jgi:hypothetical protein